MSTKEDKKLFNSYDLSMKVVDSKWNKVIYNSGGFKGIRTF